MTLNQLEREIELIERHIKRVQTSLETEDVEWKRDGLCELIHDGEEALVDMRAMVKLFKLQAQRASKV